MDTRTFFIVSGYAFNSLYLLIHPVPTTKKSNNEAALLNHFILIHEM